MKKRVFPTVAAILISTMALVVLLCVLGRTSPGVSSPALAAPMQITPTVTLVDPASAPNDLDTPIVITGTDFVSVPAVYLGNTSLSDVEWVTSTVLRATVPWGMDPGVYTLTVRNPGGESDDLPGAFTVTQGIGVWNAGELYGGEVAEMAVNPLTPTTIYAVSHGVGLFRSRNGGESWSLVYAPGARYLTMDPFTPTTIYWKDERGPLFRSDDEGDTRISLGYWWQAAYPHPTVPNTVYFINGSEDGGGVWKSTDRGQTWVTMTEGLTDTEVSALAFNPTDPMTMALATSNGHVFASTDGGESWAYASTPVDHPSSLAFNPWVDNELWIADSCFGGDATYRSTTASYTEWVSMTLPPVVDIDFAPSGWGSALSQTIFAGGCFANPYKTIDGGDTWQEFGPEGAGHSFALHPTLTRTIYVAGIWDGVHKTTDGGATWRVVNEGLTAVVPRQLTTVPGQPSVVYALTERREAIYATKDGGHIWGILPITQTYGDRVAAMAIDPFTPTRVYASESQDPGSRIHISNDGGETWPGYVAITVTEQYSDCNHVGPDVLMAHPAERGMLLAGINHMYKEGGSPFSFGTIYRSTDHGEHWTRMTVTQEISVVYDIAFDTLTPMIVYAATGGDMEKEGSGVFRSTDGGQNWARVGADEPALDCAKHLAVEQDGDHRVFAQACGEGLYVSNNHGVSWTEAIPWSHGGWVNDMLCTDDEPSVLYAATGEGLFRMVEGGGWMWWEPAAGLMGEVPVYSLATVTATDRVILYVGTTGGYVESDAAQGLDLASNDGLFVNAGVYRFTTRRTLELYLPFVVRVYEP